MERNETLYAIRRKMQLAAIKLTSPSFMSKVYFKIVLGYHLNLKDPKTLNEKLQWLKLYHWGNDKNAITCADKYAVREYIKSVGKENLLNELYYVWDDVCKIVWKDLPQKFVLKCNHGCGYNIICKDKSALNKDDVIATLDKWMHEDFSQY